MPFKTFKDACEYAQSKANHEGVTWYVNSLASSGPMKYAASRLAITDTSFGGRVAATCTPNYGVAA